MGMTIDKAIEEVQQQKLDYQEFWEEYKNEHIEALDIAIEAMKKYQKIQEILNSAGYVENGTVYSYTYDEDSRVKHIRKVVEDGNYDLYHAGC